MKWKVWFHRVSALLWLIFGLISFLFGLQNSVALVWLASVYANVKSDWGAAEAADEREVIEYLKRIEAMLKELNEGRDGHQGG